VKTPHIKIYITGEMPGRAEGAVQFPYPVKILPLHNYLIDFCRANHNPEAINYPQGEAIEYCIF
jgi:hypothetical protein